MIEILVAVLIFAVVLWIVSLIPFPATGLPFKQIVYVILAIIFLVWLLGRLGYAL